MGNGKGMLGLVALAVAAAATAAVAAPKRNIVFILVDDMRYDVMSCAGHPIVRTPHLDQLAADGVRFRNAFVTTSLCSPSRATILTGIYAHRHGVLNNETRLDPSLPTFPQELQKAGYRTAFIGKWHMGYATDEPQPGFDHWASFRGQGNYHRNDFNINGRKQTVEGYVSDVITDMAVDFMKANRDKPFLAYVSHKAVHAMFYPPERHKSTYADARIEMPDSGLDTPENYFRRPRWVYDQRVSWHGVDDAYFKEVSFIDFIRDYYRTLMSVDESVGRIRAALKDMGLLDSTLILFTSDNGFLFGEHGIIDKRCMYEESIRVPMLLSCPQLFRGGQTNDRLVLNLDICPTLLEAGGVPIPPSVQGQSFLTLASRPDQPWRTSFLYEYFWEPAYPETPSVMGVRTDRYKYAEYHGIWDANELYDLEKDPKEMHNRISTSRRKVVTPDPEYAETYAAMKEELLRLENEYGALALPSWKK